MKIKAFSIWLVVLIGALLLAYSQVAAQGSDPISSTNRTVIGQRNPDLADGAQALISGDARRGIELTLEGLETAIGNRELKMAHSNLCAGYLMLKEAERALEHCDKVIEIDPNYWRAYNNRALVYLEMGRYEESEADVARGQAIRPKSKKLKIVKGMLLDETQPVQERVEVDERRSAMEGEHDDPQAKVRD